MLQDQTSPMNGPHRPNLSDKEIFVNAARLSTSEERRRYVEEICHREPERIQSIWELLSHLNEDESILDVVANQMLPVSSSLGTTYWMQDDSEKSATFTDDWDPLEFCGTSIGPYLLVEYLGSGGMGVVYRATQSEPIRRNVAIKLIRPDRLSQRTSEALEHERRILERITHPGVVQVLDAGLSDSGIAYFVMEYVQGRPITNYCNERQLSLQQKIGLFINVCEAVHHAHQRGVIHYDLKPSNILVSEQGRERVIRIIDFGVSQALDSDQESIGLLRTKRSHIFGTPMYMSPEQARGELEVADTRSDIYALGVVLYELLCGTHPFEEELRRSPSKFSQLQFVQSFVPAPPSQQIREGNRPLYGSLRQDLDWVVMKAIAKLPDGRYASASALADDLLRFLDGFGVEAHPASWVYQTRKLIARRKAVLSALTVFLLAMAITTIESVRQASIARRAKTLSDQLLFAADMKIASDAFREAKIPMARERLLRYRDIEETSQHPNFAWKYLWNELNPETRVFHEQGGLLSIAISPEGELLVSGDDTGKIHARDLRSGEKIAVIESHHDTIRTIAFSPSGKRFVSGCDAGAICIWSAEDLRLEFTSQLSGEGIDDLEWLDDHTIFSAGGKTVRLWHVPSAQPSLDPGEQKRVAQLNSTVFATCPGRVKDIAIAPDRATIASASESNDLAMNGCMSIWNRETGSLEHRVLVKSRAISVCYSPSGKHIVVGSQIGPIYLFDTRELEAPIQTLLGNASNVYRLVFSADGETMASACKDCTVRIWDTQSWKPHRVFQSHQRRVYGVASSLPNNHIYSCSADGTVREFSTNRTQYRTIMNMESLAPSARSEHAAPHELFSPFTVSPCRGRKELIFAFEGGRPRIFRLQDQQLNTVPFLGVEVALPLGEEHLILVGGEQIFAFEQDRQISPLQCSDIHADLDSDGLPELIQSFNTQGGSLVHTGPPSEAPRLRPRSRVYNPTFQSISTPYRARHHDYLYFYELFKKVVYVSIAPDGTNQQQELAHLPSAGSLCRLVEFGKGYKFLLTYDRSRQLVALQRIELDENFRSIGSTITLPSPCSSIIDLSAIDLDNDGLPDRIFVANPSGEIHVLFVTQEFELRPGPSYRVDHDLSALRLFSRTDNGQYSIVLDAGGTRGITRFTLSSSGSLIDQGFRIESAEQLEVKQETLHSNVVIVDRETWAIRSQFHCLDRMLCTAVSPDGKWIAIAGESERIHLWSPDGTWRGTIPGMFANIRSMLFTDDSKQLCIAVGDIAEVYDPVSKTLVHRLQGHENTISIMATAPHSRIIATASDDSTICLWSLETGSLLKKMIGHSAVPRAVAFHPSEQIVASSDDEGQVILWDVATGGELLRLSGGNLRVNPGMQYLLFDSPKSLYHASNDTSLAPVSNCKIGLWTIENMERN